MKGVLIVLATLAAAACSSIPRTPPPSAHADVGVVDTSFANADGSRTIQISALVSATPAELYQAIATVEGWKTWAVPNAFGEVKTGAIMETSYDRSAKAGDAQNIKQEFLALLPDHLVVFRTVKAPQGFSGAEALYKMTTVLEITPEGADQSRLTLSQGSFARSAQSDALYDFFHKGDADTLKQLQTRFLTGPIDFTKQE